MSQNRQSITLWHYGLLVLLAIGALSGVWFLVSPIIGRTYILGRIIETLGLYPWLFPKDYAYFSQPLEPGERLNFLSIYFSSIPFGIFCTLMIVMLGWYARDRAKNDHLHAFIKAKKDITPHDVMRKMANLFPHNQFYIDYPLHRYRVDKGPARMTYTALELMIENGAINLDKASNLNRGADHFLIDRKKLRLALEKPFGEKNPFIGIDLTDQKAVAEAVHQLPWYTILLLYACFARHNALVGGSSAQFHDVIAHVDNYMNDIWKELNSHKTKHGDALSLGPFEIDPDAADQGIDTMLNPNPPKKKTSKPNKATKKPKPDTPRHVFKEYMAEYGPSFKVTAKARRDLLQLLIAPSTDRHDRTRTALDDFAPILKRHAYLFGVLASALQLSRRGGIYPPALFTWLRFINLELWNFLLYVDVPKPCAEAAGMFEHWLSEKAMHEASISPIISERTVDALIAEVRKFTPSTLVSTNLEDQAREMHRQADMALKLATQKDEAAEVEAEKSPV